MYKNYTNNPGVPNPYIHKILLIMRLTIILLFVMFVQVSANTFGQSVTLNVKNAPLSKIIKEIREQSGYDFFFNKEVIQKSKPITINVKNADIKEVLDRCLKDQPLTYKIENRAVMLKEKPTDFLGSIQDFFAVPVDIVGYVTDSAGKALMGATVRVRAAKASTITDANGKFRLRNVEVGTMLEVSYLGYISRKVEVTRENASALTIILKADVNKLEEVSVVSTGYQVISKERAAGSFAKVNMDVVANRTTSMNILQSLDGLVPGLVVNNAPLKNQIMIRGLSTISGAGNFPGQSTTAQPLYVIDGLAVPVTNDYDKLPDVILNLNPQDVESITVLKDATAASIWGARAANGVILIKTKSGSFNSKLRVNYNAFVNFQGKPELDYIPLLNSQQYVQTGIELFNNSHSQWQTISALNGGGIPPLELILYNQERGLISSDRATEQLDSLANIDNRGQIKDLFYRNAMLSNQTISLTGGSDKYAFYGSASYTNTVSSVPGEKNQTYKVNFRQDIKATKFLSLYIITDLSNNTASSKRNYNVDYFSAPYQMYRDANGNNLSIPYLVGQSDAVRRSMEASSRIGLDYNPLNEFDYGNTKSDGLIARINGGFKLNLFKGLRFEGTYGYTKGRNVIREFESLQSFAVRKEIVQFTVPGATPTTAPKYYIPTTGGRLTTTNGDQHKWDIRDQLIYDNAFGKHELTLLVGQEAQETFGAVTTNRVRGFDESLLTQASIDWATIGSPILNTVWPTYSTLASFMSNDSFSTNESTSRYTSYYANAGYTFDRKYVINASWRNDQSNLFGKDKSAQNKPIWSAGAKWNVSNEDFMKTQSWINNLSLRMTYGILGNSPVSGVAASQDITGPSGSAFFPGSIGLRIITPGNPKLSWERTAITNLGLDFSVLNDRLSATVDLYHKKTTDLIGVVYPNSLTGFTSMVGNQGTLDNKGIEVSLNSVNIRKNNFSWSTNWNFAYNKNKLVKLNLTTPVTTGGQQVVAQAVEGLPVFAVFAYQYAGLSNTGAPLIRLSDGSESAVRNISKPEDISYMGTSQPVWNGGLSNNFQYKNFRLSANMVYNMGDVMRRERFISINTPLTRNVSVDYLNRWKEPGDEANTNIPGEVNSSANDINYFSQGDINVVDASFVKLRDITLFYDLPKSIVSRIKAQSISFRAQMSNIMLWTANKYHIDPEFQSTMPINQHTFTIGANISF